MQQATSSPPPVLPDPRPAIAARVAASSVSAVARALGIPREQIARLAGGFEVRDGTLALARERLSRLGSSR